MLTGLGSPFRAKFKAISKFDFCSRERQIAVYMTHIYKSALIALCTELNFILLWFECV